MNRLSPCRALGTGLTRFPMWHDGDVNLWQATCGGRRGIARHPRYFPPPVRCPSRDTFRYRPGRDGLCQALDYTSLPRSAASSPRALGAGSPPSPHAQAAALITALDEAWTSGSSPQSLLTRARRLAAAILLQLSLGQGRSVLQAKLDSRRRSVFLLVSHRSLEREAPIAALRRAGARFVPLIHDLIPLTHPEYSRPRQIGCHAARVATTATQADGIIVNSAATAATLLPRLALHGRSMPPLVVAPLGIELRPAPPPLLPTEPYFVCLGTIEPRKNHLLLLHVWREMANPRPGRRPAAAAARHRPPRLGERERGGPARALRDPARAGAGIGQPTGPAGDGTARRRARRPLPQLRRGIWPSRCRIPGPRRAGHLQRRRLPAGSRWRGARIPGPAGWPGLAPDDRRLCHARGPRRGRRSCNASGIGPRRAGATISRRWTPCWTRSSVPPAPPPSGSPAVPLTQRSPSRSRPWYETRRPSRSRGAGRIAPSPSWAPPAGCPARPISMPSGACSPRAATRSPPSRPIASPRPPSPIRARARPARATPSPPAPWAISPDSTPPPSASPRARRPRWTRSSACCSR